MCGICGIVGFEDKKLLKTMCDVISHRGPNDSGIYTDKNVGLGNRRLSIIDLAGGHQPISNEDESIWVTYNGEIYNYRELKEDLEKKGHKFYTGSDTEVLVHLYEEFGDYFVEKLRGMFAFAIWDSNKSKLLLGRDRLGIKPLYYVVDKGNFFFGSEIKSIIQYENIKREVNLQALHNFLTLQYVPGPATMFKNIKKLQPGNLVSFQDGKIKISKYWDLKINISDVYSEESYSKSLLELLKQSVKIRLMSEVPLGVYLSGGMDSSSVVALMSEFVEEPIKTYTVGFGFKTDELKYARIVADYFETDHHELMVEPEMIKFLPDVVWHFDEPVADPAALPTYLMSKETKKYVTVVLVGEGGDETFTGYPKYNIALSVQKYEKIIPNIFKKMIIPRISYFLSKVPLNLKLKKYLEFASEFTPILENRGDVFMKLSALGFDENEKKGLYNDEIKKIKFEESPIKSYVNKRSDFFKGMILYDSKVWLCDRLLMKIDKMTMANSIEARVPFLDHKLVEFMNNLPINLRLRKYIFKKSMSKMLPKITLKRKKRGFVVPIDKWFEGELKEVTKNVLSKSEFFNHKYISNILENVRRVRNDHKLWNLLNFELWYKIYIEGDPRKPRSSLSQILG